jgi:hypothetical protein
VISQEIYVHNRCSYLIALVDVCQPKKMAFLICYKCPLNLERLINILSNYSKQEHIGISRLQEQIRYCMVLRFWIKNQEKSLERHRWFTYNSYNFKWMGDINLKIFTECCTMQPNWFCYKKKGISQEVMQAIHWRTF